MNSTVHRICVFLAAIVLNAISPAAGETRELLAHGSAEMYWIAQVVQEESEPLRTLVQYRAIGTEQPWKRLGQLPARVVSVAHDGTRLAVLLENGDWMLLWDGGSSSGALPRDGAKLLQLAGDAAGLWAIAAAGQGRTPSTSAATQHAATIPSGTRLLYRFDRGQWQLAGALPQGALDARQASLAVFEGAAWLALLRDDFRIETFRWDPRQENWEDAGSVEAPQELSRIKLFGSGGDVRLWLRESRGAMLSASRTKEWSAPRALSLPADAPLDRPADIALAGQSVRLVVAGEEALLEYSFDPDGRARNPDRIPALGPPPTASRDSEWLSALAAALLLLVLIQSMRRRDVTAPESLEAAGIALAPYGRRMIAAAIDALPVIGTFIVIPLRVSGPDATSIEAVSEAMRYPFYISTAIYVLHTLVSELLWGWTIGKKVCGLRVVLIDGRAPTAKAVVIRNLMRIVDVAMILPPLLVFLSPLRQRVGDVAAETVVILETKGARKIEEQPAEKIEQ